LPIPLGALDSGKISSIPNAKNLLKVALVLPGKPGFIKPVIARFFSRHVHTLCLRRKRDFATRPPRKQADVK
jgi:hypothetical protein